ncbi:MAG: hypothetical protein O9301_16385 [Leptospira sp.]|nr:hypothetical protein [Leptospira sp.]
MNFLETEFLFFAFSFLLIFRIFFKESEPVRIKLQSVWIGLMVVTLFLAILLPRLEVSYAFFLPNFSTIAKLNLVFFLGFMVLKPTLSGLETGVLLIIFGFFSFLFFPFLLETNAGKPQFPFPYLDNLGLLPIWISLGTATWFFEMFWLERSEFENFVPGSLRFLLLLTPLAMFPLGSIPLDWNFFSSLFEAFVISVGSAFGFYVTSVLIKEKTESEFEIGAFIGFVAFSPSLGSDLLVQLPLAILLGGFGSLLLGFLQKKTWSKQGREGFVSFFFPGVLGAFLPSLLVPRNLWPHSPFVLLAVDLVLVLYVFVLTSIVCGALLLFRGRVSRKKQ